MTNIQTLSFLFCIFFQINICLSQAELEFEEGIVYVLNYSDDFEFLDTLQPNGNVLLYPDHWDLTMGKNGQLITHPNTWLVTENENGDVFGSPSHWKKKIVKNGFVTVPPYRKQGEEKWVKKKKYPNCVSQNPSDCYVACLENVGGMHWVVKQDLQGESFFFPNNLGNQIDESGNLVFIPEFWETEKEGEKMISFPSNWILETLDNDEMIAFPPQKDVETAFDFMEEESENLFIIFPKQPWKAEIIKSLATFNEEEAMELALF